jgi:hypothetical protein
MCAQKWPVAANDMKQLAWVKGARQFHEIGVKLATDAVPGQRT